MRNMVIGILVMLVAPVAAASVTLVEDGECRTAIYVAAEVMESKDRARLRDSVLDLANYLGKISATIIPIRTGRPAADEQLVPILIGDMADGVFGNFAMKTEFQQGYRFAISTKAIGMQGETDEGISYAIYELLDRLGCRWIVPGEIGEAIPQSRTVVMDETDIQQVPGTVSRSIIYADDAFKRRNRLGGFPYIAGHALESYLSKTQLEQHPDWNAEIGGTRKLHACDVGFRLCWANSAVATAVADSLIARLDQNPVPCISISPGDGVNFCECAECRALDSGDWDPSMSCIAITDRYVHFANRIAERVVTKHPHVKLGFLAYVQFTRPPLREKLHPALIPQLAPITYCRAHTIDDPTCESRQRIRGLLEGWGKVSRNIAMYEYYFHLAEVAAPFPAIQRNLVELPIQYANRVTMWTPETLPNFESFTPGIYMGMRMAWNPQSDPRVILQDFFDKFYGDAAKPMAEYWQYIDDSWTNVPEHAGCGFSYLLRFTPDRLSGARNRMDAAIAACKNEMQRRRVAFADASLRQFELFMKLRRDFMACRFADLEADSQRWIATHQALGEKYADNFAFTKTSWEPRTLSVAYFLAFYHNSYKDLARIGREFAIATPPLLEWRYAVDEAKHGESQGWHLAEFAAQDWKLTDVAQQTWSTLGLDGYYGPVWYRRQVDLADIPAGKRIYLWVGATDGRCKVFVNGQPASFKDPQGKVSSEATGYCEPFSFEITDLVRPNSNQQLTIVGTRTELNELGTGGLLGPVLIYHER